MTISGYEVKETLYEGRRDFVYRGVKTGNNSPAVPVIIKVLKEEHPSLKDIARLKHEYEIAAPLGIEGVPRPRELIKNGGGFALILEDFKGKPLKDMIGSPKSDLRSSLKIAIRLSEILAEIHQQGIIHKDITPRNIIVDPGMDRVTITDFGISTLLHSEIQQPVNIDLLEGTLAYMSPEQTGRMNRTTDYRSDYYSLGVVLYEMTTGYLPFQSEEPLELVYSHIAKEPAPPALIQKNIPPMLSKIILKLLSKSAEDRYQSTFGLKEDLKICLAELNDGGMKSVWSLGNKDLSSVFSISQKLYGREEELAALSRIHERVVKGSRELSLIAGYAGVGKTSLVREIQSQAVSSREYFISGKFEELQRDIPYSAVIKAFRELTEKLLTESSEVVRFWKEKILSTLGENSQVIIDVLPQLEYILGPQKKALRLSPAEVKNRFNLIFQKFVSLFARKEHPLVLFLDDLQWADRASLELIRILITSPDIESLNLIAAYRDNEVDDTHPLTRALDSLRDKHAGVHSIELKPLNADDVNDLVKDSLKSGKEDSEALADLVFEKTGGNPFFVSEFLESLHRKGLIYQIPNGGKWICDVEMVEKEQMTDNVVLLMSDKILELSNETVEVLKSAACIGTRFDLGSLSLLRGTAPKRTAEILWEALQERLIVPVDENYKYTEADRIDSIEYRFMHDRIQQVAYELLTDKEKQETHFRIGRLIRQKDDEAQRDERIFDIVRHLNAGRSLIYSKKRKRELAGLNLQAGKKAKSTAAFEAACSYLKTGIDLLSEDEWNSSYELALELHNEAAEAAYVVGRFELMHSLTDKALAHAKREFDTVRTYEILITAYITQNRLTESLRTALRVLRILGLRLKLYPTKLRLLLSFFLTRLRLAGKKPEFLASLPQLKDPLVQAKIRIISSSAPAAYYAAPELMALICFQAIRSFIRFGNSSLSPFLYAGYGMILCGISGDIEAGWKYGQLSLRLLKHYDAKDQEGRTIVIYYSFINHWRAHIGEAIQPMLEAYRTALEVGDLEFSGHALQIYSYISLFSGKELPALEEKTRNYDKTIAQLNQGTVYYLSKIWRQTILNVTGKNDKTCLLAGESYNEHELLPVHRKANDTTTLAVICLSKLFLCCLFRHYAEAAEHADSGEPLLKGMIGMTTVPLFRFYASLAYLGAYDGAGEKERRRMLNKVEGNQKLMKKWSRNAAMNYLHKYYLVEAEKCRVTGKHTEAMGYFDKSISLAKENGYLNEEALANERAAMFYHSLGRNNVAHLYLKEAHYRYTRWGAAAKVQAIEEEYAELLACPSGDLHSVKEKIPYYSESNEFTPDVLDLTTIMKASRAISGEIILEELLKKLMQIVIETAGAQKGLLLLEKDGDYVIRARGRVQEETIQVEEYPHGIADISVPEGVLNYTVRTGDSLVLHEAGNDDRFRIDPYIVKNGTKSVLCAPLTHQGMVKGIIYLENNLTGGAFTDERVEMVTLISSQAAISLENALLYRNLSEEIRERRSAMERIDRLVSIVESTGDGVIGLTLDGTIRSWNPGAEKIYGYPAEEATGKNIHTLAGDNDDPGMDELFIRVAATGVSEQYESLHRTKSGKEIDVSLTVSPVTTGSGRVTDMSIVARDITERKKLEQEVLEISIREQKRIGQALHDSLGQQLTGLAYQCKILEKKLSRRQDRNTELAKNITGQLNKAISQTHDLAANLFQVEIDPGDLIDKLESMVEEVRKVYGITIRFEYNSKRPVPDSFAATHVFRIAQEGINNAVKHSRGENIIITLLSGDRDVNLTIIDDGAGLPEGETHDGGIGMRTMKYRAGMIRASLSIDSERGKGTRLSLSIPETSHGQ